MSDDSSSDEYVNECAYDVLENDLEVLDAKKKRN